MKLKLILSLITTLLLSLAFAQEPVKIGMVTTLSTGGGYLGEQVQKGFELAVEMRNSPIKIDLLVADDGLDPETAVGLVERMVERDGVKIMTGSIFSNIAMATIPRLVREGVVYVSPNAGPSELAGKGCNPNYFNAAWQNDNLHEGDGSVRDRPGFSKRLPPRAELPRGQGRADRLQTVLQGRHCRRGLHPTRSDRLRCRNFHTARRQPRCRVFLLPRRNGHQLRQAVRPGGPGRPDSAVRPRVFVRRHAARRRRRGSRRNLQHLAVVARPGQRGQQSLRRGVQGEIQRVPDALLEPGLRHWQPNSLGLGEK